MKIDLLTEKIVVSSGELSSINCVIDPEDMKYISSLLRNNYSNTILATIREVYSNAVDANIEAGTPLESIKVNCPTFINPVFSVRDYGKGLSRDQFFNLYSKYGKSTKRNTNTMIGGYGVGRFAPLSYNKDGFTISSFVNGKKSVYFLYISEDNDTKIDEIFSGPTDESDGLLIDVAVSNSDINNFQKEISKFFRTFDVKPQFVNLSSPIHSFDPILSGNNWNIFSYDCDIEKRIVLGGISYPLDVSSIDLGEADWIKYLNGLELYAPIGSVKLHHSRESLEYNKNTQKYLKDACMLINAEIKDNIKKIFSEIDCARTAKIKYGNLKKTLPYPLFSDLVSCRIFKFQGQDIESENFNLTHYKDSKNIHRKIPVDLKDFHFTGYNGRIGCSRVYSCPSELEVAYVFNDLPKNDRISARIYSLLNKYKRVIVVSHDHSENPDVDGKNGATLFKEANLLHLAKNGVYNLSDLPIQKIPRIQKTSATYSPNLFFTVSYRNFSPAEKTEVDDISIVKPYVKLKSRELAEENGFINKDAFNDIASLVKKCFSISVYGVSCAAIERKSFKDNQSFIKLKDFVSNQWNALTDAQKELYDKYHSYHILSRNLKDSDYELLGFFLKANNKEEFCPELSKFEDESKSIDDIVKNQKLTDIFHLFHIVREHNYYFNLSPNDKSSTSQFQTMKDFLIKNYPHYQYFSFYIDRCYNSSDKNCMNDFIDYAKLENLRKKTLTNPI